jgi:hypothetical protein
MVKHKIAVTMCPRLWDLIGVKSCDLQLSRSRYISKLVAEDLGVKLDSHGNLDESHFNESMVKIIDCKIQELESQKKQYLEV